MKFSSAYLRRNDNGTWKGFLRYKDEDGKWRQVSKTFDRSIKGKRAAERELREWHNEMEMESTKLQEELARTPASRTALGTYMTDYIDNLEEAKSVRPSGIADYRATAKRIDEGLGDVPLSELTPGMIQKWEARLLREGKAVNTVLKYHRFLNQVYRHAVTMRDFDWNPCPAVKKPRRTAPSPNSLDADGHARLAATLNAMGPTQTVTAATIALYTGMRLGEVCGLQWRCYDAEAGIIFVEKAIAKAGGKTYESEPKTEASRRIVPVHPNLADMLARRRAQMEAELEAAGVKRKPEEFADLYVVGHIDGRYLDTTSLSRSWKELSSSFQLYGTRGRRVTFHDLRHTFATRAIAEGADVKAVAAVLGHTDAHMTLNVYADADKESKRRAVTLVGRAIEARGDVNTYVDAKMLPAGNVTVTE